MRTASRRRTAPRRPACRSHRRGAAQFRRLERANSGHLRSERRERSRRNRGRSPCRRTRGALPVQGSPLERAVRHSRSPCVRGMPQARGGASSSSPGEVPVPRYARVHSLAYGRGQCSTRFVSHAHDGRVVRFLALCCRLLPCIGLHVRIRICCGPGIWNDGVGVVRRVAARGQHGRDCDAGEHRDRAESSRGPPPRSRASWRRHVQRRRAKYRRFGLPQRPTRHRVPCTRISFLGSATESLARRSDAVALPCRSLEAVRPRRRFAFATVTARAPRALLASARSGPRSSAPAATPPCAYRATRRSRPAPPARRSRCPRDPR